MCVVHICNNPRHRPARFCVETHGCHCFLWKTVLHGLRVSAGKRLFNIPVKCANELIYASIMEVHDAKMG